ncbi:DUF4431 domain-containing protein [Gallaecimonas mangrovi]|uniref:DUF4431 domain-containing protein n=1 Tax=Gallaecimonas mangrovi TaxID=2291597 RepID=UPI000E2079A5|nr:DUF4431 domain-containing protein [Gallaecimonas mangrovi]
MLATMLLMTALSSSAGKTSCYSYGPQVALLGTLIRSTFAGTPNYESITQGDSPETVFVLHLTGPICTSATHADPLSRSVKATSDLQLVFPNDAAVFYQQLAPKLGQTVKCKGTLFSQISGHHHTPVLMNVQRCQTP